jgi:hypothetical protein
MKAKKRGGAGKRHDTPIVTVGDLRKRLRALGNPWEPDPTLSDEAPLPVYPAGGDATTGGPGELAAGEKLEDVLMRLGAPPSNADLRNVWREAGLLREERRPKTAVSRKRSRPTARGEG